MKNCEKSQLKIEGAEETESAADGGTVTGYAATFDREPDSYGTSSPRAPSQRR